MTSRRAEPVRLAALAQGRLREGPALPRRLAIIGDGKMGRAVAQLATERGWTIVAQFGAAANERGAGITPASLAGADVAIEFTEPSAALANAAACIAAGCAVVIGTTGWYDELPALQALVQAKRAGVFWAANFSLGANLLVALAGEAGRRVRDLPGFDAHIVETHHAQKKDAPSGTSIVLQQSLAAALGRETPITSVRTGSVPGEHALLFDGPFEQLTLTHVARDRRVFAEGALAAAGWLIGRSGLFTMRDLLQPPAGSAT